MLFYIFIFIIGQLIEQHRFQFKQIKLPISSLFMHFIIFMFRWIVLWLESNYLKEVIDLK